MDYEVTTSSTIAMTSTTLNTTTSTTWTTAAGTSITSSKTTARTITTTVELPILPWPKTSEERRVFVRNLLTQVPLVDG